MQLGLMLGVEVGGGLAHPGQKPTEWLPGSGWCLYWVALCWMTKGVKHRYPEYPRETPGWGIHTHALGEADTSWPVLSMASQAGCVLAGRSAPKNHWKNQRGFWEEQQGRWVWTEAHIGDLKLGPSVPLGCHTCPWPLVPATSQ